MIITYPLRNLPLGIKPLQRRLASSPLACNRIEGVLNGTILHKVLMIANYTPFRIHKK